MQRRWMLSLLLLIGIVGYFSVPTVANFVVHAHGGNGMLQRVTSIATTTVSAAPGAAAAIGERGEQARSNILNAPSDFIKGWHSAGSGNSNYKKDKLSGKPS